MLYRKTILLSGYIIGLLLCMDPVVALAPNPPAKLSDVSSGIYADLMDRLVSEGHDQEYVERVFSPVNEIFYQRLTRINLIQQESPGVYRRMFSETAIASIRSYISEHEEVFSRWENEYGVDREVIASIMFVESRFGQSAGTNLVLYVLSSMSLADEEWNIEHLIEQIDEQLPELTQEEREEKIAWLKRRARSKSQWAYSELNTLLRLRTSHGINTDELRGSWAGAFGIPQFLPTSFEAYAVDGDDDGLMDLYNTEDAIASVANYLYRNGWRGTITTQKKRDAVWRYNHSQYYVDLIMDLAGEI